MNCLYRLDNKVGKHRKIHITPHERCVWVIQGGKALRVFDTDTGRVDILICYDVEFPELVRLLAKQDIGMLCFPF